MSQVKLGAIWQHDTVLPYILKQLKERIEEITPVEKIYLFGSRGRVPANRWNELEGKDWDVLVQAKIGLTNASVLVAEGYYIDLMVLDEQRAKEICGAIKTKMIYPIDELEF